MAVHGQITFQKTYGGDSIDIGLSVQQTTDGGYILFGETNSFGNGGQDMYLVKTDNYGNQLWYKTYGGPNWEYGISVEQTTDEGYILCGSYSGIGNDTMTLIKTDAGGNEVWNKRYRGSVYRDVGQFVRQTTDGGFIAVGFTGPGFTEDIYVVKTDFNGNIQWSQTYGGAGRDLGECIRQTSDGGYVIFGQTNSFGHGGEDMYLIRTNSMGDTIWTKTYGTSSNEIGSSLYITTDHGFIMLGYQDTTGGNLYLVKADSLGNEQWSNYYGGTGWDLGYCVQQTTDGGYVLAGRKENTSAGTNDMYCVKTDNSGVIQWQYTYPKGILSDACSIQQTTDGGYILLGSTTDTTGGLNIDMYLVKINASGILSVHDENSESINVSAYPNPFNDYATIEFDNHDSKEFSLKILNLQGQVVSTIDKITTEHVVIERNNLESGLYFFQLLCNDKQVIATGKLILE